MGLHSGEVEGALAGAIKLDEDDALPGAEEEPAVGIRDGDGGADDGGEQVVGGVLRVVWVAVAHLWQELAQGLEEVEVGAGVEVGGGNGAGGVGGEDDADAGVPVGSLEELLDGIGEVENLVFLAGGDGDGLHASLPFA